MMRPVLPGSRSSGDTTANLVKRMASWVAMPACAAIGVGLVGFVNGTHSTAHALALETSTVPLRELTMWATLASPLGLLTAGLAALAVIPVLTVAALSMVMACSGQWREALIAGGVLITLGSAAFLGHR